MSGSQRSTSWLSSIIKNGRWYLLSSLMTKALAILTLTLLTHSLNPAEFGDLSALMALTQALPVVLSLYLDAALARLYYDCDSDKREIATLFSTVFWFVGAWGGGCLAAFLALSSCEEMGIPKLPTAYLLVASIPVLLMQLTQFGLVLLRQSFESRRVMGIEVVGSLIGVVATILLVSEWNYGVIGRLLSIAISSVCVFFYTVWYFVKSDLLIIRFNLRILKCCLLYSAPLLPNLAAGWISGSSDKLIIAKYADLEAVGMYSFATSVASLLYVFQDAVTQVTGVKTLEGMSIDRTRTLRAIGELCTVMWGVMLLMDYCAFVYSEQVVNLFAGKEYKGAAGLIGICGFFYVLSPQSRILQSIIGFHKKSWILSTGAIIMAASSLGLNFWLVPMLGYKIAPYVLIVSLLLQWCWLFVWTCRLDRLNLEWGKAFLLFIIFLCFVWLHQSDVFGGLAMNLTATLIYSLITFVFLHKNQKALRGYSNSSNS